MGGCGAKSLEGLRGPYFGDTGEFTELGERDLRYEGL